jgi:hypothetical protein
VYFIYMIDFHSSLFFFHVHCFFFFVTEILHGKVRLHKLLGLKDQNPMHHLVLFLILFL